VQLQTTQGSSGSTRPHGEVNPQDSLIFARVQFSPGPTDTTTSPPPGLSPRASTPTHHRKHLRLVKRETTSEVHRTAAGQPSASRSSDSPSSAFSVLSSSSSSSFTSPASPASSATSYVPLRATEREESFLCVSFAGHPASMPTASSQPLCSDAVAARQQRIDGVLVSGVRALAEANAVSHLLVQEEQDPELVRERERLASPISSNGRCVCVCK
jgi:hypothetical protein